MMSEPEGLEMNTRRLVQGRRKEEAYKPEILHKPSGVLSCYKNSIENVGSYIKASQEGKPLLSLNRSQPGTAPACVCCRNEEAMKSPPTQAQSKQMRRSAWRGHASNA